MWRFVRLPIAVTTIYEFKCNTVWRLVRLRSTDTSNICLWLVVVVVALVVVVLVLMEEEEGVGVWNTTSRNNSNFVLPRQETQADNV